LSLFRPSFFPFSHSCFAPKLCLPTMKENSHFFSTSPPPSYSDREYSPPRLVTLSCQRVNGRRCSTTSTLRSFHLFPSCCVSRSTWLSSYSEVFTSVKNVGIEAPRLNPPFCHNPSILTFEAYDHIWYPRPVPL